MKHKMVNFLDRLIIGVMVLVLFGTTSCSGDVASSPQTWIDNPREGASIPLNEPITINSHVFVHGEVAEVVLSVNGEPYRRDVPAQSGKDFVAMAQEWTPEKPGTYSLQVQGFNSKGQAAKAASISIFVKEKNEVVIVAQAISVTPEISITPKITITPTTFISITPSLPPASNIQFYADPDWIKAGDCSTIHWAVENARRVIFGGIDQPFVGSYRACLCGNERYTLRVIDLDGSERQRSVDVNVKGTCATDTPPPPVEEEIEPQPEVDKIPPSVPVPAVPANGLTVSCRTSQNLVWQPSTDNASGISGYFVKLEIQVKKGAWQSAAGYGPVSGKQVSANVQCGGIYRWMVRAQDGAGNVSAWSSPSSFSVNLD